MLCFLLLYLGYSFEKGMGRGKGSKTLLLKERSRGEINVWPLISEHLWGNKWVRILSKMRRVSDTVGFSKTVCLIVFWIVHSLGCFYDKKSIRNEYPEPVPTFKKCVTTFCFWNDLTFWEVPLFWTFFATFVCFYYTIRMKVYVNWVLPPIVFEII